MKKYEEIWMMKCDDMWCLTKIRLERQVGQDLGMSRLEFGLRLAGAIGAIQHHTG